MCKSDLRGCCWTEPCRTVSPCTCMTPQTAESSWDTWWLSVGHKEATSLWRKGCACVPPQTLFPWAWCDWLHHNPALNDRTPEFIYSVLWVFSQCTYTTWVNGTLSGLGLEQFKEETALYSQTCCCRLTNGVAPCRCNPTPSVLSACVPLAAQNGLSQRRDLLHR